MTLRALTACRSCLSRTTPPFAFASFLLATFIIVYLADKSKEVSRAPQLNTAYRLIQL